jgi:hypothetical protein
MVDGRTVARRKRYCGRRSARHPRRPLARTDSAPQLPTGSASELPALTVAQPMLATARRLCYRTHTRGRPDDDARDVSALGDNRPSIS